MKNRNTQSGGVGERRGSALLITLLMLGVMMTLTLGVSTLVIREIRVTQSVVDANKAFYAAEAGVERALLGVSRSLAGVEPAGSFPVSSESPFTILDGTDSVNGEDVLKIDPGFAYQFETSNTSDAVPGFPDDQPIFVEQVAGAKDGNVIAACQLSDGRSQFALAVTKKKLYEDCPRATFRKLGLNETDIIPLYSVMGGSAVSVDDFLVQYYLNIRDGSAFYGALSDMKLEQFDVLRWKIYGKPLVDNGPQRTESIADFYPGVTNNGPQTPVCIGTDATIVSLAEEKCLFPSLTKTPPTAKALAEAVENGTDLNDLTLWSAARECYQTDAGIAVTGGAQIKGTTKGDATGCQMRDFIDNHKENYLILTNMVNPNIVGISNLNDPNQLARADIYYRVLARTTGDGENDNNPKLVKDFAEIRGTGEAANGSVVKTLDVRYKAPSFLPVFNFSLYKTADEPNKLKFADTPQMSVVNKPSLQAIN